MSKKNQDEQRIKVFSALADPTRLRIVELLKNAEELSGSEIAEQLGISLALMCHHSKIAVQAGLLAKRKGSQTAYYLLNKKVLLTCLKSFE